MQVKTYGINGLTEWHGDIKAGSISVRVSFTGGTASPSGAQPAYYMTKDPITQFVIENSNEFKSGFIHLEMSHEIPGEHPRMAVPKETHTGQKVQPEPEPAAAEPAGTETGTTAGTTSEGGDEPLKVSVSSKTEAIEWLKDHYPDKGYNGFKLKGKAAFEAACNECNVVFDIQG